VPHSKVTGRPVPSRSNKQQLEGQKSQEEASVIPGASVMTYTWAFSHLNCNTNQLATDYALMLVILKLIRDRQWRALI
jgi:hypothetical protein